MPSLATVATIGLLIVAAFALGERQHRIDAGTPAYQSPCLVSWDENADSATPSTFCIMTRAAAHQEKTLGAFKQKP